MALTGDGFQEYASDTQEGTMTDNTAPDNTTHGDGPGMRAASIGGGKVVEFAGLNNSIKAIVDGAADRNKPGRSQQLELWTEEMYDAHGAIRPLYDPEVWAAALELSTRNKRCAGIMARNTVGLGWSVDRDEEEVAAILEDSDATEDAIEEVLSDRERALKALLKRPNHELPLSTLLELVKQDEEGTGNGYIEVARDSEGRIDALYHLPAKSVRKTIHGTFVQRKTAARHTGASAVRHFVPFGSSKTIDAATGDPLSGPDAKNPDMRANEVLHFRIYSPLDPVYGVPRASTAEHAIAAVWQIGKRNHDFFNHDATPRMIIIMEGGTEAQYVKVRDSLEDFIDSARGHSEGSRVMLLQVSAPRQGTQARIQVQETGWLEQDATFSQHLEACNEEIRECYGLAKVLFGTADDVNRASAVATLQATISSIFLPETNDYSYRLSHNIAREFHPALVINLTGADVNDASLQAEIANVYGNKVGALTINEIRADLGYEAAEHPMADIPVRILTKLPATTEEAAAIAAQTVEALEELERLQEDARRGADQEDAA